MSKSFITYLVLLFHFFLLKPGTVFAQDYTSFRVDGSRFPLVSLRNTRDTLSTKSPALGQIIFNTNQAIAGEGALGDGFYVCQTGSWKRIDSTMSSGTIVLSSSMINPVLTSKGFNLMTTFPAENPLRTTFI